jgi:regulatory protein
MTPAEDDAARRRALAIAWRALARRDHTVAELRMRLERRGVESTAAEAAVSELAEAGYLDDGAFARRFVDDRRRLDGWGEARIEHELLRRGVRREQVEQVLAGRSAEAELEAARLVLASRVHEPLRDDRARARALGLLVRRGYASEIAHEAVRCYEPTAASSDG